MILGVAAMALRSAEVLSRKQVPLPSQRLALKQPVSLYERFRDSRYRGARERFAFYQLASRFEGARVFWPESSIRRHGWYLERVSGVVVLKAPLDLRVPAGDAEELIREADLVGRLDRRPAYFIEEVGADYALVEVGEEGPFLWVPRWRVEPAR